jgi:hypothetical protein
MKKPDGHMHTEQIDLQLASQFWTEMQHRGLIETESFNYSI